MRVASIDVGSNSLLMLIAEQRPEGRWTRVEEHAEVARISEGLDASGELKEAPVARARAVLQRYVARARELGVQHIWITGTAPFRRARNGAEVARALSEALGVDLRVVSGEEEGALTLRATTASFPMWEAMNVLDIGGASTELLSWTPTSLTSESVDLGVVRLLERYVQHDPPLPDELERLREGIAAELRAKLPVPEASYPLVGVAGTVTSLAALDLRLESWDPDRVQGHRMGIATIRALGEKLWPMTVEARCREIGIDPRRADLVAVGAWYLHAICEHLGVDEVVVSDRGLRWGRLMVEMERS